MKKRILAIDDSKAIRFLLQTVLGRDYEVITVPDGYSAMYYLSRRSLPHLIIADPVLPDMEDWELIHQLSSSGIYGDIPTIVLSGLDNSETEAKCLEYGVSKYFLKPFNPVELIGAISNVVKDGKLDEGLLYAAG
ncbi:MAG TPA: response regulator [Puia sp.]|jgi:DNA-binding response OmpR family regulator